MKASDGLLQAMDSDSRTDLSNTVRCLMRLFGGPEGLATHVFQDFEQTTPGSANRIKLELAMLELLRHFSPEDELPDNEEALEAMARRLQSQDE